MDRLFEIDAYRKGSEVLAVLRGSLVASHSLDAKTRLMALIKPPVAKIHIYLAELEFVDSAGLGVIVGLKMTANRAGVETNFLEPKPRISEIFRVSKLDTIFNITSGVEAEAICGTLQQSAFCLWRDHKDTHQSQYNTQADFTDISPSQWTQMGEGKRKSDGDDHSSEIGQLCTDAVLAIRQSNYEKAIEIYRQMLDIDANNMSALNNLAVIYEKKAEWHQLALECWTRVLNLSEKNSDERHAVRARTHLDSLKKLMS